MIPRIEGCNCPLLETWPQMKSFGMGMIDTHRWRVEGTRIAGTSEMSDTNLNYWRGFVHGLWLKDMTTREKNTIIRKYTILRLER